MNRDIFEMQRNGDLVYGKEYFVSPKTIVEEVTDEYWTGVVKTNQGTQRVVFHSLENLMNN